MFFKLGIYILDMKYLARQVSQVLKYILISKSLKFYSNYRITKRLKRRQGQSVTFSLLFLDFSSQNVTANICLIFSFLITCISLWETQFKSLPQHSINQDQASMLLLICLNIKNTLSFKVWSVKLWDIIIGITMISFVGIVSNANMVHSWDKHECSYDKHWPSPICILKNIK